MELFKSLFEGRDMSLRDPALKAYYDSWGGGESVAGPLVTENNALKIGAVLACVRIIAEAIASLPLLLYRRTDGGKERASDHPLYGILHDRPNPFMTSFEFREALQGHLLLWGNAFAEIERDGAGRVAALWPLPPNKMRLQEYNRRLYYYVTLDDGGELQLRDDQVLHVRGLSSDGRIGYSPIALARETLGLTKAEEEYRARFFRNDGNPGGVLEHPGELTTEAQNRLRAQWAEKYSGVQNKFKPAILEEGMKWVSVNIPAKDAEFIEGRKFQIEEIARIFRVPLVLLQSTEKATSWGTGIEQFMLAFVMHTIQPWCERSEERYDVALLTEAELARGYYIEHQIDALLRADAKTRAEALQIKRLNGVLNANEWRALDNENAIAGQAGTEYWRPANMGLAGEPMPEPAKAAPPQPGNGEPASS